MSSSITTSAGVIVPTAVAGYRASRPIRNREHPILGSASSDFTHRPAGLRRGSLTLIFPSESAAVTAVTWLCLPEAFTFATDKLEDADMLFNVVGSDLDYELGAAGEWIVVVPYQERTP